MKLPPFNRTGRLPVTIGATAAAVALLLADPGAASAGTFSNKYAGSDETQGGVTSLKYSSGHASFVLRLNVDGFAANESYSISMYDRNGKRLWGKSVAGKSLLSGRAADQYYSVGGNVTRISVDPSSWWSLVKWSRA